MSCSSPWEYDEGLTYTVSFNFDVSGSVTSPGYSIPSYSLCLLGVNWGGVECTSTRTWTGICKKGKWSWGTCTWTYCASSIWYGPNWYWYDCSTIPSVPIIPTFELIGSANVNSTILTSVGTAFTATAPPGPYQISALTINSITYTFTLAFPGYGSETVTLTENLGLTLQEENGDFSAELALDTLSSSFNYDGFEYSFQIGNSLLFCLNPVPPQGWVNLLSSYTLSVSYEGIGYTVTGLCTCPIVSVED